MTSSLSAAVVDMMEGLPFRVPFGPRCLKLEQAQAHRSRPVGFIEDSEGLCACPVGGPSQLETWDPKPGAPANVRGPFRAIRTNVPGIQISEHFPLMARIADRYAILRSVHHDEAPIHETGHQLMQTAHLFRSGMEW